MAANSLPASLEKIAELWPRGFSREDFRAGVSLRRNKAISRVLMRLGVMEGYGSGYDRITAAYHDGGCPQPEWVEYGPQIKVVLRPHPGHAAMHSHLLRGVREEGPCGIRARSTPRSSSREGLATSPERAVASAPPG